MSDRFSSTTRHTYRAYGLTLLQPGHFLLDGVDEFKAHGDRTWRSSYLAMDWLLRNPPGPGKAMELGCGWAALAVLCAKRFGMEVVGVDIDPEVAAAADILSRVNGVDLDFMEGSWSQLADDDLRGVDLLMGADICYWESQVDELFGTMRQAMRCGVGTVLIADPGRPSFDRLAGRVRRDGIRCRKLKHSVGRPVPTSGYLLVVEGDR